MGCVCFVVVWCALFSAIRKTTKLFDKALLCSIFFTTYISVFFFKKLFGVEESESNILCCHNRAISMNEFALEVEETKRRVGPTLGELFHHLETE